MKKAIIYDFDKTIYSKETSMNFTKFYLKRHPKKIFTFLKSVYIILFHLRLKDLVKVKNIFFEYLKDEKNLQKELELFWQKEDKNIFPYFFNEIKENKKEADTLILISASPEFLLNPIAKKLGFDLLIATRFDRDFKMRGKNCKGDEKVRRLYEKGEFEVLKFYSDSMSDKPLFDIAKKKISVDSKGNLKEGLPNKNGFIDKWK